MDREPTAIRAAAAIKAADGLVTEPRRAAGEAYLKALRAFNLNPEGLFWALDYEADAPILVLVSRYFDIVGPLALSELLFKAYRASATPKEIDPFIVRLHSPDHHMIRVLIESLDAFQKQLVETGKVDVPMMDGVWGTETIAVPLKHVYVMKDVRHPSIDLLRKWMTIERRVDALAA